MTMNLSPTAFRCVWTCSITLVALTALFYFEAYFTVSQYPPGSVPIHHDDYTNYAGGSVAFDWSWNRPLSSYVIHLLAFGGPSWLIGAVRFLSVLFAFLSWILLCQLVQPRPYWVLLLLFGIAVFSTPIIVEYAHYTGMITHLLSGCLGLGAVALLFRSATLFEEAHSGWFGLLISVVLLVLSSLSKEDFVLLYALSLIFAVLRWPVQRRHLILFGGAGLLLCAALMAASRFVASSNFLGIADRGSTYFIDLSAISVAQTVYLYLLGGSHPAMKMHGWVVAATFAISTLLATGSVLSQRRVSAPAYFVLAALTVIAPYSVLPNHVNAYYEFLWLPMLVAALVAGSAEVATLLPSSSPWLRRVPVLVLVAVAGVLSVVDYPGRLSISRWYDTKTQSNASVLAILNENRTRINAYRAVCITGADAFSPWFLHSGQYLRSVMGLDAIWYVVNDRASPHHLGLLAGAATSQGRVVVVPSSDAVSSCVHLRLREGTP